MAAIKEKLSRIRKGAADPAPAADPVHPVATPAGLAPAGNAPASVPPASTAGRFGGLKNVRVGDFAEADEPGGDQFSDDDIPFEALSTTPPPAAKPQGRFSSVAPRQPVERQVANMPSQARSPAARRPAMELPEIQWDDPARPAGSSYSEQEWLDAEQGGANVVFEMVKPDEVGLCAIPRATMNGVEALLYSRSLVVSEDVESVSQWPVHARVIHRDPVLRDREVVQYRIVRAADEIKKTPWLQGSVLRNELEVAFQESKAQQADKARFGNMPRQR